MSNYRNILLYLFIGVILSISAILTEMIDRNSYMYISPVALFFVFASMLLLAKIKNNNKFILKLWILLNFYILIIVIKETINSL
jgi:hypothetical protein